MDRELDPLMVASFVMLLNNIYNHPNKTGMDQPTAVQNEPWPQIIKHQTKLKNDTSFSVKMCLFAIEGFTELSVVH